MNTADDDPEGNATLLPEPFEVNAEVVEKAALAARAALLAVAKRFNRPISRPVRAAPSVTPSLTGSDGHAEPAP
ncbi:MAG: hypothetical protein IPK80_08380 [Nannocystis sp.]|nr:hypothetical protein [Nannocystis sp.]